MQLGDGLERAADVAEPDAQLGRRSYLQPFNRLVSAS